MKVIHSSGINAVALAWRRFARGLPSEVNSVERALETGLRSFSQWRTCLDTANRQAARVNRHVHRRAAPTKPDNVGWRSLTLLAKTEPRTAEGIARALEVHPDVVRRALKTFRERGWVAASATYTRDEPRTFTITALGRSVLDRHHAAELEPTEV